MSIKEGICKRGCLLKELLIVGGIYYSDVFIEVVSLMEYVYYRGCLLKGVSFIVD